MVDLALSKIGYGMRVRVIQCEGGVCAHKLSVCVCMSLRECVGVCLCVVEVCACLCP